MKGKRKSVRFWYVGEPAALQEDRIKSMHD
ncbi:MAG: phage DNA packaging protein J [Oliverpabstia sp.]